MNPPVPLDFSLELANKSDLFDPVDTTKKVPTANKITIVNERPLFRKRLNKGSLFELNVRFKRKLSLSVIRLKIRINAVSNKNPVIKKKTGFSTVCVRQGLISKSDIPRTM